MYAHRILIKKVHRRINPQRYNHPKEVDRWYADGGDVKFRYTYPLTKKSIVIDAGGYEGEWSQGIYDKYGSKIFIFEPIKAYFENIKKKFRAHKNIKVYNAGLAGRSYKDKMTIDDVSSSSYKKGRKTEMVEFVDIKDFCDENKIKKINLFKINIEGGEYELLERIIDTGLIKNIDRIQVQFHNFFPDAEKRMEKIQTKLSKTHRLTYQYWFVWDNWERKGLTPKNGNH